MPLYLCEFDLHHCPYMGDDSVSRLTRLAWATDPEHARDVVECTNGWDRSEPGSDVYSITNFRAHEAAGTPC